MNQNTENEQQSAAREPEIDIAINGAEPGTNTSCGHPGKPSLTRAEASRLNGAKSRGPVTVDGKRRSSMNALKHGLTSRAETRNTTAYRQSDPGQRPEQQILLYNENARLFTEVHDACVRAFQPADEWEWELVGEIVQCRIQLRRHQIVHARLLDRAMFDDAEAFGLEQQICNATEDERLAAALEHTPGLLHASSLIARQMGQWLRQQRWLVKELREHRKEKPAPDHDNSGGGSGTAAISPVVRLKELPSEFARIAATAGVSPLHPENTVRATTRIPVSRRQARRKKRENEPETAMHVAAEESAQLQALKQERQAALGSAPTAQHQNEPSCQPVSPVSLPAFAAGTSLFHEVANRSANLQELVEPGWLPDITGGAQPESLFTVSRRVGRRQHNNRKIRTRLLAKRVQHLTAAALRHVQIQQNDVGSDFLPGNQLHRRFSIRRHRNLE